MDDDIVDINEKNTDELIASLLLETKDEEIRSCLRSYEYGKSLKQLYNNSTDIS